MKSVNHLFQAASKDTLLLLQRLNQQKKPIFVIPTKYISAEAAQVGFLLHSICNPGQARNGNPAGYKSFFCNSQFEALQGAIKISRHRQVKRYPQHQGLILILDQTGQIQDYFPAEPSSDRAILLPGLEIFDSLGALESRVSSTYAAGCILRMQNSIEQNTVNHIQQICRQKKIRLSLDFSDMELPAIRDFCQNSDGGDDVYIWGERLTNQEIPFGAFSMSDDMYMPWNNIENCLLHSSTYSGNLLALNKAKETLLAAFPWPADTLKICSEIEASKEKKKKHFSAFVNPNLEKFYQMAGYNLEIEEAFGCYLTLESTDGKEHEKLLDCLSGGAMGVFGHNPQDLTASVLSVHDPARDYWRDLSSELSQLTGFEVVFPAVSGATAVEIGMFLGLLAQTPPRKKVIVFSDNYSGKLLLPIIASPSAVQPNHYFAPLYQHVVIDTNSEKASDQLLSEIRTREVGLIWFECLRGNDGEKIPDHLIDIIHQNRDAYGYYIGVDEILMGMYRSGPMFSFQRTPLKPDIVTLSKALTYMSFPIGVTLVSAGVCKKAKANASDFVDKMKTRYMNQLGAHIALHCLRKMQSEQIAENVQKQARYLSARLEKLKTDSNLIERIEMAGLYFGVHFKKPWWIKILGPSREFMYLLLLTKCWKKAGVFAFFDTRLMPALCLSEKEADQFLTSTKRMMNLRPWKVLAAGISKS